jgi:FkbM family methyltransferase
MQSAQLKDSVKHVVQRLSPAPLRRWREASYFRRYGEFELRLVEPLCQGNRDAIDVGANLGAYVHFMRRFSPLVYAFEPVPWLAQELRRKFPSRVVVHNIALSDRNDVATLHLPLVNGQPDAGLSSFVPAETGRAEGMMELRVRTCRLDDAYDGDAGFIKIDVEGHERAVLDGAAGTIARCQPNILVEIEERFGGSSIEDAAGFFHALGYQGYFVDHGELRDIAAFDPRQMQRAEDIAGFAPGLPRTRFASYVNNFIFIHRSKTEAVLRKIAAILAKEDSSSFAGTH